MSRLDLDGYVERFQHDGLDNVSLGFVLEQAVLAVEEAPDEPLLEIGTYRGGTARALLTMLQELRGARAPLLVTVDPFGSKTYAMGLATLPKGEKALYTDATYVEMKRALAPFPNHAHFLMTGAAFLALIVRSGGFSYWRDGHERRLQGFSFAFVDGAHDAATVLDEVEALLNDVPTRRVVVDNVDMDPLLLETLRSYDAQIERKNRPPGAQQALLLRRE